MAGPDRVRAANLLRLLRLFRHGHRARAYAWLPAAREFQRALYRKIDHRLLAALAYLADDMDPRLSLRSARRQSGRGGAHLRQSLDLLSRIRAVARRELELRIVGRLQRPVPDARPPVPGARTGATRRGAVDRDHACHRAVR